MTYNTAQNGFALPYWHDQVAAPQLPPENLPEQVDCAIVGAGFTGLCVALHLLQAGRSVVLLDAMRLGQGASGKNGGMVGPSLHKLGLEGFNYQLIEPHQVQQEIGSKHYYAGMVSALGIEMAWPIGPSAALI